MRAGENGEPNDIEKIIKTYRAYIEGDRTAAEVEKYSHIASLDEIKENEYNLNIPRYVDTFEEEEIIDIEAVNIEIAELKCKIGDIEKELEKYLKEMGLDN